MPSPKAGLIFLRLWRYKNKESLYGSFPEYYSKQTQRKDLSNILILPIFYPTYLEINIRCPDRIEKTEGAEGFDFEATIGEKSHKWEESEVWSEGESTARTSWEDSSCDTTDRSYAGFSIEVFTSSE